MTRFSVATICLMASGVFGAKESNSVGSGAVWADGVQFLPEIHKVCDQASGTKLGECFAEQMPKHASPEAVLFTRSIHNEGWLRSFRKIGKVDIAYVEYPFRANENRGQLLVNGSPSFLDVDELKRLPKDEMKIDSAWTKITVQKPGATLFPGDRSTTMFPLAIAYPDGAQEFVAGYKVVDGCHACAILGTAFFGFKFTPKGKFSYTRYMGVESATSDEHTWPIHVRTGQRFTLVLSPASEWSLAQPGAGWIVRRVDDEKSWSFETVGAGTTKMTLHHGSDDLALKLVVAPGLRK